MTETGKQKEFPGIMEAKAFMRANPEYEYLYPVISKTKGSGNPTPELARKERELACEVAMQTAAEIINKVCGAEGSRVIAITEKGAKLSFSVPPDVMDKINGNPGITLEEATETLYRLPWSREWSAGIAAMVHGRPEWEAMPAGERERIQKRLIREKLAPQLLA